MILFKMCQLMECRRNHYHVLSHLYDILMSRVFFITLLSFIAKALRKNLRKSFPENVPKCLPEKAQKGKSPKDMSLYRSFDFSGEIIEVTQIPFSLERLSGRIFFYSIQENIFCGLFFLYHFFFGQGENTPGKAPAETQSMKMQVKSGGNPVRKNIRKIMQNANSDRFIRKSTKLTYYAIPKIQS